MQVWSNLNDAEVDYTPFKEKKPKDLGGHCFKGRYYIDYLQKLGKILVPEW